MYRVLGMAGERLAGVCCARRHKNRQQVEGASQASRRAQQIIEIIRAARRCRLRARWSSRRV